MTNWQDLWACRALLAWQALLDLWEPLGRQEFQVSLASILQCMCKIIWRCCVAPSAFPSHTKLL